MVKDLAFVGVLVHGVYDEEVAHKAMSGDDPIAVEYAVGSTEAGPNGGTESNYKAHTP